MSPHPLCTPGHFSGGRIRRYKARGLGRRVTRFSKLRLGPGAGLPDSESAAPSSSTRPASPLAQTRTARVSAKSHCWPAAAADKGGGGGRRRWAGADGEGVEEAAEEEKRLGPEPGNTRAGGGGGQGRGGGAD